MSILIDQETPGPGAYDFKATIKEITKKQPFNNKNNTFTGFKNEYCEFSKII